MNDMKTLLKALMFLPLGLLLVTGLVVGQANPGNKVSIASPTAGALGKYVDMPVNYHTGMPQISIPIYTIQSGSLSLPISLSYHASGIKVMEPAGWTGIGWALNAGGVITRSVIGLPDDNLGLGGQIKGHYSDYGYNNYLFVQTGCSTSPPPTSDCMIATDLGFSNGLKDGEPDLFFFNFGGYSGKFYFTDDRTPVLVPEQDIKIETDFDVSFRGFTITTPDGAKYYFGSTGNQALVTPIEITKSISTQEAVNVGEPVSSWFLNKIVSADGVFSINFIYQQENYSYYTISTFPIKNTYDPANSFGYTLVKNCIQGVRLSQINFANGTIDFTPATSSRSDLGEYTSNNMNDAVNTQAKALASISINNSIGFCKKFSLSYSYFTDNSTPLPGYFSSFYSITTDKQRLKLDSVKESSCDASASLPPYIFNYFTEFVPRRLSFGQDHWGYNNGITSNTNLIPAYMEGNVSIAGANRNAQWPAMQGGSLQQITYPTGGYTVFDFEPHDTYTTYTKNQNVTLLSMSVGFSGNPGPITNVFAGGSGKQIKLTNSTVWPGTLLIYDNNNVQVGFFRVGAGLITQDIVDLPSVTCSAVLSLETGGNQNSGGTGVQLSISGWSAVSIAENTTVGGLRIKTVTINDGTGIKNLVTSYNYRTNAYGANASTGILYSRPVYVQVLRNDTYKLVGTANIGQCSANGCVGCDGSSILPYFRSAGSLQPLASTQGSHIGYCQVEVTRTGNGKSVYKYYGNNSLSTPWIPTGDVATLFVNPTTCSSSNPSYPPAPLPFEYMRGELQNEAYYSEAGPMLKEKNYTPVYLETGVSTPGYKVATLAFNETGSGGPLWGTEYELKTARKTQTQEEEINYTPGIGSISTISTSYNESPYHHQVTRTTSVNSVQDALVNKQKFAFDFRVPACDIITDCSQTYLSSMTTATNTFNGAFSCTNIDSWNCIWLAYQQYRRDKSLARINYVNCRKTNFTNPTNAFKTAHDNAKATADIELKPVLELQDKYINAPIETTVWKAGKLLTAAFNKYDYASNPAGNVYPSKTQEIKLAAPSIAFAIAANTDITLTKDARYSEETSVQFDKGKLVKVMPKSGVGKAYIWDYKLDLPISDVTNADPADIAYSSFEADGTGNWSGIVPGNIINEIDGSITGYKSYTLTGSTILKNIESTNNYTISYWSKNGSYNVNGTMPQQGRTINVNGQLWTYFEHTLTGATTASISGSGVMDELRLYPKNARMNTYTYIPLVGLSSQCDDSNQITYYEYDSIGRLILVRDEDTNILKKICYNYAGQVENCNN